MFASNSDWFIALFMFVVIGQSSLLWIWFHDTQLKTSLLLEIYLVTSKSPHHSNSGGGLPSPSQQKVTASPEMRILL